MIIIRRYSPAMFAVLFWASNFVFGALLITQFTAVELTFWRWFGAAPILVGLAIWLERPNWRAALAEWKLHVLQGAVGMVGYTLFLYQALDTTTPVTAAVITAVNPALITIAAVIFLRERISRLGILGIVMSFVGVLLVVLLGQNVATTGTSGDAPGASGSAPGIAPGIVPGDLLIIGAILLWTTYAIIGRGITTPPITATAIQVVMSVLIMVPILAFTGFTATPDASGIFGIIWIMIFPSALAYLLWNVSVEKIGAARTGIFLNVLPVFTALIAVILGAALGLWQVVGGAVVLLGVWLTTRINYVKTSEHGA